jgi:hypothetical protein
VPAVLAASIIVQKSLFESRYDVSGHAGEHLSSATAPFFAAALVAILLWATPRAVRQPLVLAGGGLWLGATVLVLVGNVRVIDALVRAGQGRTPTGELLSTPEIAAAHDLADLAPWLGVAAALALTAALRYHRHITNGVAAGAAVLSVVFPPWVIPGAGVLVLTVARGVARHRSRPGLPGPS